jgi:hypothetical protein
VDLIPANFTRVWNVNGTRVSPLPGIKPSEAPAQEVMAIELLTLEQYHKICFWILSRPQYFYCSASAIVNLKAIIACPSGDRLEDSVEIALLPDAEVFLDFWRTPERATREVMEGGWTRYYEFILAAWRSVLIGKLPVSPPVIYLTVLSS